MTEHYRDRDMDGYNISASQVKAHAKCPRQYYFRYIEGKEASKKGSDYLALGSRVHESIEEVLQSDDAPPFEHPEAVKAAIQNTYADKEEYPLPDDLYEDGLKCCKNAAKYLCKQDPEIVGIEERVEYDISRPDMETGVTAIMDIVTDGEIWDWKTGRIRDDIAHDEKIQGSIYMAAYYQEYGEEPEAVRFIYVKEGKVRSIDPSDENWEYMLGRAKALLRAKKAGEFPAEPGDMCYWCDYEFWCDASPVGMGNVPYEDY